MKTQNDKKNYNLNCQFGLRKVRKCVRLLCRQNKIQEKGQKRKEEISKEIFFCTPCNLNVHARTAKPDRIEKKFDLNRLWKQIFFLYRLLWKAKSNEACCYEFWFLAINCRQVENEDSKSTIMKYFFCLAGDPLYVGFDLTIASFDSISEVSMVSTNFSSSLSKHFLRYCISSA